MPKPHKCPICRSPYEPRVIGQKTCFAPACAIEWTKQNPDKAAKALKRIESLSKRTRSRQKREGRERLMTRSDWLKRAQAAVNAYCRARDLAAGYGCICCDRPLIGKIDAGHYLSVGSHPEIRFDERNIHAQTVHCNQWKSGNAIAYRIGLIKRYGQEIVDYLEGPHPALKLTIPQIQAIEQTYKAKLKALQD